MSNKRGYTTAEAMNYLGCKRRSFDKHIMPYLENKGIKIGTATVFEVVDLDAAWESYKIEAGSERPGKEGGNSWDAKQPVSTGRQQVSMLTSFTKASGFDSALSDLLKKRKAG